MDTLDIYNDIYVAIGKASGCWNNLSGAGTFKSDEARKIADELYNVLRERIRKSRIEALTDYINLGTEDAKRLVDLIYSNE
jgi:hypothetical protein